MIVYIYMLLPIYRMFIMSLGSYYRNNLQESAAQLIQCQGLIKSASSDYGQYQHAMKLLLVALSEFERIPNLTNDADRLALLIKSAYLTGPSTLRVDPALPRSLTLKPLSQSTIPS